MRVSAGNLEEILPQIRKIQLVPRGGPSRWVLVVAQLDAVVLSSPLLHWVPFKKRNQNNNVFGRVELSWFKRRKDVNKCSKATAANSLYGPLLLSHSFTTELYFANMVQNLLNSSARLSLSRVCVSTLCTRACSKHWTLSCMAPLSLSGTDMDSMGAPLRG